MTPAVRLLLVILLAATSLVAQRPPSGGPGGTPNRPTQPTPTPTPPQQQRQPRELTTPIFLAGRVVMEDGSDVPERASIERVCQGFARREAYTDGKGYFSFQVGGMNTMVQDASVVGNDPLDPFGADPSRSPNFPGPMGGGARSLEMQLMGCDLRASLPGYVSSTISLAGRRPLDRPEVGTLVLYPINRVKGTTISANSLRAPKPARKSFEKGLKAVKKKKLEEAETHFRAAVQVFPEYAEAWYHLGLLREQSQRTAEARQAYETAIASDSKFVRPYFQLASLAAREQKWHEVVDLTQRGLDLNPVDFPLAYFYHAVGSLQLRNLDAAEKSARRGQMMDAEGMPRLYLVLANVNLQKRDYRAAADGLREYLRVAPEAPDAPTIRQQLQQVEGLITPSVSPAPNP